MYETPANQPAGRIDGRSGKTIISRRSIFELKTCSSKHIRDSSMVSTLYHVLDTIGISFIKLLIA
jgi:hypothetical protein